MAVSRVGVIAIGRSGLLFDTVRALADSDRYRVGVIVTDEAYAEYDVGLSDFAELARQIGAELLVTRSVSTHQMAALVEAHDLSIGISVNWRFLIPGAVLDLLPHGLLNLHVGRLPDYKGNATANWAILNGEPDISADVHRMVAELDAGDVLARATLPLGPDSYVDDILRWSRAQAPRLFLEGLASALDDPESAVVRGSTTGLRCYPRLPSDGEIDWTRPAAQIARLVRASSRPYPGAFTGYGPREVRVWRASPVNPTEPYLAEPGQVLAADQASGTVDVSCGEGAMRLEEIEIDGQPVRPADGIRGIRTRLGARTA